MVGKTTFAGKIRKFAARVRSEGLLPTIRWSFSTLRNDWRGWAGIYLLLNPRRVITKLTEKFSTEPFDRKAVRYGNYCLFPGSLSAKSVVYSFGVGTSIDFDLALAESVGCTVHCFDPTPRSIAFMQQYKSHPCITFIPKGVWTQDGTQTFFGNTDGGEATNASITNLYNKGNSFSADCRTLESFMRDFGHDRIDVLKMDIEGSALPVLERMLEGNIRPRQIAVELEREQPLVPWLRRVTRLFTALRAAGYRVIRLPRAHQPYHSIEVLCVLRTAP